MEPKTFLGKLLIMLISIWGAILISLVILVVTNVFKLSNNQKKAMKDINHTFKAAKIISLSVKFFMAKKKYY